MWIDSSAKFHINRLEALKLRTQQAYEKAFGNELDVVDRMMEKLYQNGYYHTCFEIQKGFHFGWSIGQIDERKLNKVISKPWTADGRNFSDRIWQSKTSMVNELHQQLTRTILQGKAPDDAIRHMTKFLQDKTKNAKYQAGRLVMTEQAFISSAAQRDAFSDLDVEEFEVVATLDSITSEICQEMDGQHFPMKEYQIGVTAPPFHPNCRSHAAPYFEDDFGVGSVRIARGEDGKTYYVPADMTYKEWKKKYVDGNVEDAIKLSNPEIKALNDYIGSDSYKINEVLRQGEKLTESQRILVKNLDSALDKLPKYKGNLQRSLHFRSEDAIIYFINQHEVGTEKTYKEFLSTTKGDAYNPDGQVQIFIEDAKNAVDISSINEGEQEVLYKRGSSFYVLNVVKKDGKYYILLKER